MDASTASIIVASSSMAGTVGLGYLAYRVNKAAQKAAAAAAAKAAEVESQKVDQTAYNNAIGYYEKTLKLVSAQVDRLTAQLDRVSAQLATERDVSNNLRNEMWALEQKFKELSATVEDRSALAPKPI